MMLGIKREVLGPYCLAALSGGLLAMSYAMHPLWWAAWLAPAPVIVATLRAPVASRRWLTLLAGVIGGIGSFS
jgi:apolipoprotein N-acyltransferase